MHERRAAQVSLQAPVHVEGGGYHCEFSIPGNKGTVASSVTGIDSFQALVRALAAITAEMQKAGVFVQPGQQKWSHSFCPIWTETEHFSTKLNIELDAIRRGGSRNDKQRLWSGNPLLLSSRQKDGRGSVASRRFRFKGKIVTVEILAPVRLGSSYRCDYRFIGMSPPKSCAALGDDAFQALYLAYYFLWFQLTHLRGKISWELAPEGQLGLPVPALSTGEYRDDWPNTLKSILNKRLSSGFSKSRRAKSLR